jgi:urea transport system permease protein
MNRILMILLSLIFVAVPNYVQAQEIDKAALFRAVIADHKVDIIKGSVKTAPPILEKLTAIKDPNAMRFLGFWQEKSLWYLKADIQIFVVQNEKGDEIELLDPFDLSPVMSASKGDIKQIKPNSGLRALIAENLVAYRLRSDDIAVRQEAVSILARSGNASHLKPLRTALSEEQDVELAANMRRLERLLTMQFGATSAERIEAIDGFKSDLTLDTRANLNRIISSQIKLVSALPENANIGEPIVPGSADLSVETAYQLLIDAGLAKPIPTVDERKQVLVANIENGKVDGFTIHNLADQTNRDAAYLSLVVDGKAPFWSPGLNAEIVVAQYEFARVFDEPDSAVTTAALRTLKAIQSQVAASEFADILLDGLSLASIYFLAAIGLAITFGVMGVINMAHGEFIMMGAYTGYVVQQFITNYTLSLVVAVPLAFGVTFMAGVLMERLVIRHLYHRPLETLLATFGISIALQQLAKNIFGTQARPLTAPSWLDGALVINDVISISWIRIAIFGLSVLFFISLLFVLNKTRFGLETRAVTQNRRMAANMGINPNYINMLTFGLGSGIAGIAGVAIGLYAKVTSEMGGDYIVQSFMTVVVGGVGNIWGTLAGAVMIGFLQKGIEWFNPANTLAAQTYMIIFIIIFIQFRPRGIIALKGRAAGD